MTSPKMAYSPGGVNIFLSSPSLSTRMRNASSNAHLGGNSSLSSSLELNHVLTGTGSFSANESTLEKEFCKDFVCCGLVLEDLHELNQHIVACHHEMSSQTSGNNHCVMSVGLDALFLNELVPGTFSVSSDTTAVDSQSPQNGSDIMASPKGSLFSRTSLSPEMSPMAVAAAAADIMKFDEQEPLFSFSEEDEKTFTDTIAERRDSVDTLDEEQQRQAKAGIEDLFSFDDDLFENNPVAAMFEDSLVGVEFLGQLDRIGLQHSAHHQADDALERSLSLMGLLHNEAGPLLNSGSIESSSPPVAPTVRFGPHHEEDYARGHIHTFPSSAISLSDIYQEIEDDTMDSAPQPPAVHIMNGAFISSPTIEPSTQYNYASSCSSDSEMSIGEQDIEAEGFGLSSSISCSSSSSDEGDIDIETWEAEYNGHHHYEQMDPHAPIHPRYVQATVKSEQDVFKVPKAPKRRQQPLQIKVPIPASRSSSSSTKKKSSSSSYKCTKKMRVGSSFLSVQADSVITASSPTIASTPPHFPRKACRSAAMASNNEMEIMSSKAGCTLVRKSSSALSAALCAAKDDVAAGSSRKPRRFVREDDEEEDYLLEAVLGEESPMVEDEYQPLAAVASVNKRKNGAVASRKRKEGRTPASVKKTACVKGESSADAAVMTPPARTPSKKAAIPDADLPKLDPEFVRRFKSQAVAQQAALTATAISEGATLADLVIARLPKIKEGEEKRLKLGSLSILDPDSAEKRFFCPVCKKEYKNANGLKYHLNHSHTKPNELPSGYYFGKKKKEAEDLTKPFVCTVGACGKRYKNLNGLKYHTEHGHVPGDFKAAAVKAAGDDSEDESDDE
ncbi:Transcriptional regulator of ribosomal biogenesis proteins [Podochytrium sp. JEL0797]|nr:Transcriptional regulator of ribosomal biogenesis proteins [Podochytrium sp. JEL0797]